MTLEGSKNDFSSIEFHPEGLHLIMGKEFTIYSALALSIYNIFTADTGKYNDVIKQIASFDWMQDAIQNLSSEVTTMLQDKLNVTEEFAKLFEQKGGPSGDTKN